MQMSRPSCAAHRERPDVMRGSWGHAELEACEAAATIMHKQGIGGLPAAWSQLGEGCPHPRPEARIADQPTFVDMY